MQLVRATKLSVEQETSIRWLEKEIHQFDQTVSWAYLDNLFNFNVEMPFCFLAIEQAQLVSIGVIYAETQSEAELTIKVHPKFRQRGIASQLMQEMVAHCRQYGVQRIIYKTETDHYYRNSYLQQNYREVYDSERESLFVYQGNTIKVTHTEINVRLAVEADLRQIAKILTAVFDDVPNYEEEYETVRKIFSDIAMQLWVITYQDKVIGTCSIEMNEHVQYLFAIAISPRYQKRKFGQIGLQKILHQLDAKIPIQLSVENSNQLAQHVYRKIGFSKVSETLYIE